LRKIRLARNRGAVRVSELSNPQKITVDIRHFEESDKLSDANDLAQGIVENLEAALEPVRKSPMS
jgi:hypothetical protein